MIVKGSLELGTTGQKIRWKDTRESWRWYRDLLTNRKDRRLREEKGVTDVQKCPPGMETRIIWAIFASQIRW